MPQRFLRPGITNSDGWNAISWQAQSFFIRILTLVDDYGRYDGRLAILHAHCFALRSDVTIKQTAGFRSELQESGLATVYIVDAKEFIQLSKWQERARGNSKYPDPLTGETVNPQDSAGFRSGKTLPSPSSIAISHRPSPLATSSADADTVPAEKELLEFLNQTSGGQFRPLPCNLTPIKARMKEHSATVEEIKKMISRQVGMWKGTKMAEYLRPSTLFNAEKFAAYYGMRDATAPPRSNGHKETVQEIRERKKQGEYPESIKPPIFDPTKNGYQ